MLLATLKALADENRLRLVAVLARGEFTVQELTAILASGQSRISHHLKVLAEAGLVAVKRQGTWAYYRLAETEGLAGALLKPLRERFGELPGHQDDLLRLARILEERRRASRDFFERHARQWDEMAATVLPIAAHRAELLAQIPSAELIVEIGVGTGVLLAELSRRGERVIGIDHAPAMIGQARQRLLEDGLTNVELRLGEMSHLPLADATASVILLNMVLHHAADPAGVFLELRRVLAPAGHLVIADLMRHEEEWVRSELADQWLGFERCELEGWLNAAGFTITRFTEIPGNEHAQGVFILQAILQ